MNEKEFARLQGRLDGITEALHELSLNEKEQAVKILSDRMLQISILSQGETIYDETEVLKAENEKLKEQLAKYHWKSYPENKPEKDGDYLIRSVIEPQDEVSSDVYCKEADSWKYFEGDVIAFCEIPE